MVKIYFGEEWIEYPYDMNLIFVIVPGAGTTFNRKAYKNLEKYFIVRYFGESGGEYDKYPQNWYDNRLVSNTGKHLGGICELVKNHIIMKHEIPGIIITGSRGGQVTLGKIWNTIWRGPSIIINAGSLTTITMIPKDVYPLFITMHNDYFTCVNRIEKVNSMFKTLSETKNQKGYIIHLPNEKHMPKLDGKLLKLLQYASQYLIGIISNIPIYTDEVITHNL